MTEQKKVTLELSSYDAAVIYQVLFESQKGYTTGESTPERINAIRNVILSLDEKIGESLE